MALRGLAWIEQGFSRRALLSYHLNRASLFCAQHGYRVITIIPLDNYKRNLLPRLLLYDRPDRPTTTATQDNAIRPPPMMMMVM